MPSSVVAAVGGIIGGAAMGIFGGGGEDPPDLGPAPEPSNAYVYDEDGKVVSQSVWDPKRNAYIQTTNPEPDPHSFIKGTSPSTQGEWDAWTNTSEGQAYAAALDKYRTDKVAKEKDEKTREEIRQRTLGNLNQTPEDRVKAYDEYAKTFSDVMHKDVDTRYNKTVTWLPEKLEAQGLGVGSKAYADILGDVNKQKQEADVDIANKAALAKEDLANTDRNYWVNLMNSIDAGSRADAVLQIEKGNQATQLANQGTAATLARYTADSNNAFRGYEAQMQANQANTSNLINTASGLAFLYGFNKGGTSKSAIAPSVSGGSSSSPWQQFGNNFSYLRS